MSQVSQTLLQPTALLTTAGALLAFLIGFYTLIGRERKAPYLINFVFLIVLFCIGSVILTISSAIFPAAAQEPLLHASAVFLLVGLFLAGKNVWLIYIRITKYGDSISLRNLALVRLARRQWKRVFGPGSNYEHSPNKISEPLSQS